MKNILYQVAKELQETMEETFDGHTVGSCYLTGHCLTKIFERLGFESRKVTGKLAILIKNGQSRYVTYGRFALKSKQVGVYHTWCEVTIDGKPYIVDPSLKSNLEFIKKAFRIKINPMVEKDTLVTDTFNTYYYKYYEDEELEYESLTSLKSLTTKRQINSIIETTLDRLQFLFDEKSA